MDSGPFVPLPCLVLFDVGNVLISLRPWREALPVGENGDGTAEKMAQAFRWGDVCRRFERGAASVAEFCHAVRQAFSSRLEDDEIVRHYRRLLGKEVEGMSALILDLKHHGVRVAALTDTSPIHLEALLNYAVVRELDSLLASCVTGRAKPDPNTFRHALESLDVPPRDAFFTDDLPENVEGARQAGLRAELFRDAASLRGYLGI